MTTETTKTPEEWALELMAYAMSPDGALKLTEAVKQIQFEAFKHGAQDIIQRCIIEPAKAAQPSFVAKAFGVIPDLHHALDFYADPRIYNGYFVGSTAPAMVDGGAIALKAIAKLKEALA